MSSPMPIGIRPKRSCSAARRSRAAEDVDEVVDSLSDRDAVPGESGRRAGVAGEDDEMLGAQLVEGGIEEAAHDQMVEAAQDDQSAGRLMTLSMSERAALRRTGSRRNSPSKRSDRAARLLERFQQVREFQHAPVPESSAGRFRRAIDARRQPDEMASRAYHLVLRDVRRQSLGAALPSPRFRSTPSSLIPITTPRATCTGAISAD